MVMYDKTSVGLETYVLNNEIILVFSLTNQT